jgi:hypothetical protein
MRSDPDYNYSVLRGIRPDSRPGAFRIRAAETDPFRDLRNRLLWKVISHLLLEEVCVSLCG